MVKKGISPLIATVLIIGFTIVLAALVMQWGSQLFRTTTEQTGVTSDLNIKCSSGLSNLKILDAVISGANVNIRIDNANEQVINGILVRKYLASGNVLPQELTGAVEADPGYIGNYGIKTVTVTADELVAGDEIGVIPKIKATDGKAYPCPGLEKKITL